MQIADLAGFLKNRFVLILSLMLVGQGVLYHAFSRQEVIPPLRDLSEFPASLGLWRMSEENEIEPEVLQVLKADDTLSRVYTAPDGRTASLFVAYYRSQRSGKTPHSPKNCLPGSGWLPLQSDMVDVEIPGAQPIQINRYMVAKGEFKSLVFYWYQSHNRVVASEYKAKLYLAADAMRFNRSDAALVRIVVPVGDRPVEEVNELALSLVRLAYPNMRSFLPV